jgi:hypothetical protein
MDVLSETHDIRTPDLDISAVVIFEKIDSERIRKITENIEIVIGITENLSQLGGIEFEQIGCVIL